MATYGVPLAPVDDTDALRRRIDVLAACVDISTDAYQRVKAEAARLMAERVADAKTIRHLRDDLDGMHLANERPWSERNEKVREVEALRRELRERAS